MKDEKYNLNLAYTKDGIVCAIEKSDAGFTVEDGVNEYNKGENTQLEKLGPIGINGKKGIKGISSKKSNYKSNYKRGFRK